ncbi:thioredoxin [Nakamurella panacisegetis]|uniref:Thioredoxin n=1 Tax=Nakamurella panacisegetis TaxID=1090615 RepID=A0A1H0KJH9_9ACTN|nr:thioredoxin domain-containing protein [Nakamurella panacisegetis]SDO55966.1 thioredoxin [Nakamurella panacisegetis]
MSLPHITDDRFDDAVLNSALPVLVEFTADWCPPCKMIAPVLGQIALENRDRLAVVAMDVDAEPRTALGYQVLGMPTLALFVNGELVAQAVGAKPKSAILRWLEPHLATVAAR